MQAHEEALALLTSAPQKTSNASMKNLLSIYGAQEGCNLLRESVDTIQRKTILEELSEILHLRGRLQQMGATFSDKGEMLTYGNPSSPKEFEAMIRLGPLYDDQWNSFFIETYEPPDSGGKNAQLWAGLRTLKKLLQNEGVVFGRQHQRYSFGDSSTRLRRLCCAYDELRNEWLVMLRTSLPAQNDAQVSTLPGEESSSESDSESSDDDNQRLNGTVILDTEAPRDITNQPVIRHHRRRSLPHNIGWRFSDDSIPRSCKNATWRSSDDLSFVPERRDVERANAQGPQDASSVPIFRNCSPKRVNALYGDVRPVTAPSCFPTNPMLHGASPLQVSQTASHLTQSRAIPPLKNVNAQSRSLPGDIVSNAVGDRVISGDVAKAIPVQEAAKEDRKHKTWSRVRRWFRNPFSRK
ncbi:hypothetical protein CUC08_Gglean002516 [Alternaria sp. MG1]|uniref:Uncharacterized protein n=1 Tax=Alternaria tenuissima TaxID=119927 RepID=A0AB37W9Q6_9PLEO|nr:hypothetical protein CUC08_Gglean002516 [Alternaria sp. MG1]RYN22095.1 hypothetical protein AA0115_g9374 [Alternaria tenuissima]RYO09874.1 hypothetical protein AA0121_g10855 [Alternaria tenuissima]